jgi:hypothetical protein
MFDPKRRIQEENIYDRVDMVPDALHSMNRGSSGYLRMKPLARNW